MLNILQYVVKELVCFEMYTYLFGKIITVCEFTSLHVATILTLGCKSCRCEFGATKRRLGVGEICLCFMKVLNKFHFGGFEIFLKEDKIKQQTFHCESSVHLDVHFCYILFALFYHLFTLISSEKAALLILYFLSLFKVHPTFFS